MCNDSRSPLLPALALLVSFTLLASPSPAVSGAPRIGINLAGPVDWNTELPFVDVFRLARPWISQRQGAAWGKGPRLELDRHGWVRRLEPGCWAETLLCTIRGGHYPSGRYTVLYRGRGRLTFGGAARVVSARPGRIIIEVDARKGPIFLRIVETDPTDYVRDIHVIMPGFEDTWQENPFHPLFLARWRGIACIRFMDWMKTNGSELRSWDERPRVSDATFASRGVPLEWMIDLCNRLDADAWFCIPHQADDVFVRRFAEMVRDRLEPERRVYVEYSNEVWNGIFPQHRWAASQGLQLKLATKPWEAAWRYTGYRARQIFRIWTDVFGGTERLVRVLATQAVNPYVSRAVLESSDAYRDADALAIAPYLSLNVTPQQAPEILRLSVQGVLDRIRRTSLPNAVRAIKAQKELADRYGLELIAYEGGQHFVGVRGAENNERLTKLLLQVNAADGLEQIYDAYFDAWQRHGGGLFCYYASVSRWSKWGSWGVLQYADEGPASSPKYRALVRWAQRWGQPLKVLRPERFNP